MSNMMLCVARLVAWSLGCRGHLDGDGWSMRQGWVVRQDDAAPKMPEGEKSKKCTA